jgi:tellurite methyltransferase
VRRQWIMVELPPTNRTAQWERPEFRGRFEYRVGTAAGSTSQIGAPPGSPRAALTPPRRPPKVRAVTLPPDPPARAFTAAVPLAPAAASSWCADAIVLDARETAAFAAGHLPGAGRMTSAEFGLRRAELPPRHARVLVVHDEPALAREAAEALAALEYREVGWLDAPLAQLDGGTASREPQARLWRPCPFLERMLAHLAPGRALDLASGAGRESVFLALAGWRVDAWDHDPEALARADALAARHGTSITTRVVELEGGALPEPGAGWDTIVVCRFLHRPLFPWIESALAPGGTLVYETFRRGQEAHGRPKLDRYLLEPGELTRAFPSLRVETYEEHDPAGGPVVARLLARRA